MSPSKILLRPWQDLRKVCSLVLSGFGDAGLSESSVIHGPQSSWMATRSGPKYTIYPQPYISRPKS